MTVSCLAGELSPIDEERPIALVIMEPPFAADLDSRLELDGGVHAQEQSEVTCQQISIDTGSRPRAQTCEVLSAATPDKKAGPRDITNVRQSLTNIRKSLSQSPELRADRALGKSVSLECLGAASRQLFPSKSLEQEVARLARRVECMERAFLMSPTEAIGGQQQDTNTSPDDQKLCAQFVEVLERGREARKREVAELEQRMAQIDSLCCSSNTIEQLRQDFSAQLAAQDQDHSASLAESAEAFAKALECERAARQTDVLDLHDAVARQRLDSSTGGTSHCSPRIDAMSTEECPQCTQVDPAAGAAIVSSKATLSQRVVELHWQLSEDLMIKFREKLNDAAEDWERRIEVINELFPKGPETPRLETSPRNGLGEHMRGKMCKEGQTWDQNRDLSRMSTPSIPKEAEAYPRCHQMDSEHASAADIADECMSTTALPPHARSIRGASKEALAIQGASKEALAKRPNINKSVMSGAPLLASQGSVRPSPRPIAT